VAGWAQSGKALWHFNTGQNIHASPMSYAVSGKQFVAIASGSDVFSFELPQTRQILESRLQRRNKKCFQGSALAEILLRVSHPSLPVLASWD
jgi:hypothetical protein